MSEWQDRVSRVAVRDGDDDSDAVAALRSIPETARPENAQPSPETGQHDWDLQVPDPPARTPLPDRGRRTTKDRHTSPPAEAPAGADEQAPETLHLVPAEQPRSGAQPMRLADLLATDIAEEDIDDEAEYAGEDIDDQGADAVAGVAPAYEPATLAAADPWAEQDETGQQDQAVPAEPVDDDFGPIPGFAAEAAPVVDTDEDEHRPDAPVEQEPSDTGTGHVAADDDFGAILAAAGPGGSDHTRARTPRRGLLLAVALVLIVALAAAGVALVMRSPATTEPAAADTLTWQPFQTMQLPVSAANGPTDPTTGTGFAATPLGAALAAAHLSARVDPAAGPASYTAVLDTHTAGDRDRLATAVATQYADAAAAQGITDGSPLPGTPAGLDGWRVDGDPDSGQVTAHLSAGGSDYAIPLVWQDGDWRLDIPSQGQIFAVGPATGTYQTFEEQP